MRGGTGGGAGKVVALHFNVRSHLVVRRCHGCAWPRLDAGGGGDQSRSQHVASSELGAASRC